MIFICTVSEMTEIELAKLLAEDLNLKLKINKLGAFLYLDAHFVDSPATFTSEEGVILKLFNIPAKSVFDGIRDKAGQLPYIAEFKHGMSPISVFK